MKILLESLVSMISGISLLCSDSIVINFADEVHNIPIGAFIRNVRIIISSTDGEEKYNKSLIQLELEQYAKRLEICFSNKISLHGKGGARTNLTKIELAKGDEVILMYKYHLLKKFTIREDYESKL